MLQDPKAPVQVAEAGVEVGTINTRRAKGPTQDIVKISSNIVIRIKIE